MVIFISGCSSSTGESAVSVKVFSDLPFSAQGEIETYLQKTTAIHHEQIQVDMFLPSPEKVMIELVAGEGDLYIVQKDLLPIVFDPVILKAIDVSERFANDTDLIYGIDDQTGEEEVYAIAVGAEHPLFAQIGFQPDDSYVAVMLEEQKLPKAAEAVMQELLK